MTVDQKIAQFPEKAREMILELMEKNHSLEQSVYEHEQYRAANDGVMKKMSDEYNRLKQENEKLRQENTELNRKIVLIAEKERLRTEDIYGQSTEKLSQLVNHSDPDVFEDEADTEKYGHGTDSNGDGKGKSGKDGKQGRHSGHQHGKRSSKKEASKLDMDSLLQRYGFQIDFDDLDSRFGRGEWRIAGWHLTRTLEQPLVPAYCYNLYKPVISVGLEHSLVSMPLSVDKLIAGSYVSASIGAAIDYFRFVLGLPTYRISRYYADFGVDLSRQTICNWSIRLAEDYFALIVDRLFELLLAIPYHQCDETFVHVIKDGRKAGSNSYFWVQRTSELYDCNPIILFCFELTRGTDHLRRFYEDFKGYITCDAYVSYKVLGEENLNVIMICGCMMHLRRRFAESLSLIDLSGTSAEDIESLTETRALKMIGDIYDADEPLKTLSAQERLQKKEIGSKAPGRKILRICRIP